MDTLTSAPAPAVPERTVWPLAENPLARREWRALAHQARDWRLWLGLRVPKDARGWGVPAVAWFFLAPYVVLAALATGHRFAPEYFTFRDLSPYPVIDVLALCLAMLGIYVCMIAVALMAPVLTRERERETWESLRTTITAPREILMGLLAGRLGPVLLAYLGVGAFWVLARPHYAPLLQRYAPFLLDGPQIGLLVLQSALFALAAGTVATAASAWCRTSGVAITASVVGFLALAVLHVLAFLLVPWPARLLAPPLVSLIATAAAYRTALARL